MLEMKWSMEMVNPAALRLGVNAIRRRGARRQDKPVDVSVEPQTEADRQLSFELRREYLSI